MTLVSIVYYSQFHGHTKILADEAAKGIVAAGGQAQLVDVQKEIPWDVLKKSDAIVFAAPTYMGSVPAQFKKFMDDSSAAWMQQEWKDKVAAGFTCAHAYSGDKLNTLVQMAVFAAQHGMIWVGLAEMQEGNGRDHVNRIGSWLGMMAQADTKDPAPVPPVGDLKSVYLLGQRVTEIAKRLKA